MNPGESASCRETSIKIATLSAYALAALREPCQCSNPNGRKKLRQRKQRNSRQALPGRHRACNLVRSQKQRRTGLEARPIRDRLKRPPYIAASGTERSRRQRRPATNSSLTAHRALLRSGLGFLSDRIGASQCASGERAAVISTTETRLRPCSDSIAATKGLRIRSDSSVAFCIWSRGTPTLVNRPMVCDDRQGCVQFSVVQIVPSSRRCGCFRCHRHAEELLSFSTSARGR